MSNVITFSGWGQKHDSLANIFPNAENIDYKNYQNIKDLFDELEGKDCDILVGWSLGGQIALRAASNKILNPKSIILFSTPFQFVANKTIKCGIDDNLFIEFENNFVANPEKLLKQFSLLIAKNDSNFKNVARNLDNSGGKNKENWKYWLKELKKFSCQKLDFSNIPETLIIHGRDDTIVDSTQTSLFLPLIGDLTLKILDNCGHAPHLHNEDLVNKIINDFLDN